jgi:MerR family transcriptional regulator, heat shock protein HspR
MNDEPCYVISIAARMVPLHAQTLRHYERVGLVKPARSKGQIRLYSEHDIERVRRIQKLIEDLGLNLAGVEVILHMQEKMEELQRAHDARVTSLTQSYEEEIQRLRGIISRIQLGDLSTTKT